MTRLSGKAELLNAQEAANLIENEPNPVTRALLSNANFWLMKALAKNSPAGDFDLLFFVDLLRSIFGEHDVLRRTLEGEKVGQFFEDRGVSDEGLQIEVTGQDPRELVLHGRVDVTTASKLRDCVSTVVDQWHVKQLSFECKHLDVVNPWVLILLVAIGEEARRAGTEVFFSGLETDRTSLRRTKHAPTSSGDLLDRVLSSYLLPNPDK